MRSPKNFFNFKTIHCTLVSLLIILGGKLGQFGGEVGQFGGEASPMPPSLDETLVAKQFIHNIFNGC